MAAAKPVWLVERTCAAKHWYASAGTARAGKRSAQRAHGKKYRVYRCPWCNGWHLTSKKETV